MDISARPTMPKEPLLESQEEYFSPETTLYQPLGNNVETGFKSESPILLKSTGFDNCVISSEALKESEWYRCCPLPLPPPYPLSLVGRVITMSSKFVNYIEENFVNRLRHYDDNVDNNSSESRFRRRTVPVISLQDYMLRICNYVVAIEPIMLLAVLAYAHYLDPQEIPKGQGQQEDCRKVLLVIDLYTVHRFVMTSVCIASKALGDHYYSNSFYAKVGGISTLELNALELELVTLLDWRLQCSREDLQKYWSLLSMERL